jgi:exosortase
MTGAGASSRAGAAARRAPLAGPALAAAIAVTLAVTGAPVARDLLGVWWNNPYYSYGVLIPIFSGYLIWESRARLAGQPAWWPAGLALAAAGVALCALGRAAESLAAGTLGLVIAVIGLALAVLGPVRARMVGFPLAFLALATPLPKAAIEAASLPLQHLAAGFTHGVLGLLGIPAELDGLFIRLEGVDVHVSEACNGLRFLLAMVVVGVAFAAMTQTGTPRRLAVVALAVGLAIGANLLRVAGTALVAHAWGPEAATGTAHLVYGKVVYAFALPPFVGAVLWLRGRSARA